VLADGEHSIRHFSPSNRELAQAPLHTMAPKKEIGHMNKFVYDAFLWTFSILVELFFREVHPRGSWKVPKEGPVIFVCAPHANQVGDAVLLGGGGD
jgi:1-acyl-sn-glycerol-3-phosphate acyltransferase